MKRLLKMMLPAALTVSMLAGCSFGGSSDPKKNEQASIKVMYYDEQQFFRDYGMLFSALYPNIDIEVVSTQTVRYEEGKDMEAEMMKFIEENQPDVLMLDSEQYEKMAAEGKLYDLETRMSQEKYNTENIVPGLIDYLKEKGGGKLYGMVPDFYGQALYYNKDLFDKYNIPYPTDRMSWNDVLQLARMFPTDGSDKDRVYGLKMSYDKSLFQIGNTIGNTNGLSFVNANKKEVTINTDGWKSVFQTALDAIDSKTLYFESENQQDAQTYEDYLMSDPFISGRLAMMVEGPWMRQQIEEAENYLKDKAEVVKNWDLVTVPVDPQNPDYSSAMSFNTIYAINAQSPSTDAAWQFINYVTSDEYARVASKSGFYNGFPIRTDYIKDEEGRNYAAFYALKPSTRNPYGEFDKLPSNFYMEFDGIANQELTGVQEGTKTLDEALQSLQEKGQAALIKAEQEEQEKAKTEGATGTEESADEAVSTPAE
ncbi:ABC transporter substrate-binding protein [Paenibacillus thailandensis]|uniref:ABC transporter substrate-binding protein n=1 Tax=Paenibacillus thailandensis TaxID=393250 RepID=A0ABW5R4G0_9BACL